MVTGIETFLFKLVLVFLTGGLIGIERELKSKSAGFRTIMLICMGSFLFTSFSQLISPSTPDRIASNIVTGIGFLGAGVIFRDNNRVNGLTTAASIWVTAALGMGISDGTLPVCWGSNDSDIQSSNLDDPNGSLDGSNQLV